MLWSISLGASVLSVQAVDVGSGLSRIWYIYNSASNSVLLVLEVLSQVTRGLGRHCARYVYFPLLCNTQWISYIHCQKSKVTIKQ